MRRTRSARLVVIALLTVLALAAGACGGDDDTPSSAGDDTATTAADTTDDTDTTEAEPALTGDPVKVGFLNNEGGAAFSVPELRVGAEVAEDYVNTELGGIAGRPVDIIPCATDGSPEKSIDCANQLLEQGVVAMMEGTDLGADAILPILKAAGVPMVGHVQFGVGRMFDENSYYFGAAALAYGAAALKFYSEQGVEKIVWFFPDDPTSRGFNEASLIPTSAKLGIDYTPVYFDPASPNWSVLATTAVAENPDVSGSLVGTDGQCQAYVGALRDAGFQGSILAASCNGLYDALGDKAVGVHTDADHWVTTDAGSAPTGKQKDLQAFSDAMDGAGEDDLVAGNAIISFADVVNLSRVMSTIDGDVDGPGVATALRGTIDFDSFAGPVISCDHSVLPGNSACSDGLLFLEVSEKGTPTVVTDDFVDVSDLLS
jgi:branched-chain amino acid transport system substrate-binding protein